MFRLKHSAFWFYIIYKCLHSCLFLMSTFCNNAGALLLFLHCSSQRSFVSEANTVTVSPSLDNLSTTVELFSFLCMLHRDCYRRSCWLSRAFKGVDSENAAWTCGHKSCRAATDINFISMTGNSEKCPSQFPKNPRQRLQTACLVHATVQIQRY